MNQFFKENEDLSFFDDHFRWLVRAFPVLVCGLRQDALYGRTLDLGKLGKNDRLALLIILRAFHLGQEQDCNDELRDDANSRLDRAGIKVGHIEIAYGYYIKNGLSALRDKLMLIEKGAGQNISIFGIRNGKKNPTLTRRLGDLLKFSILIPYDLKYLRDPLNNELYAGIRTQSNSPGGEKIYFVNRSGTSRDIRYYITPVARLLIEYAFEPEVLSRKFIKGMVLAQLNLETRRSNKENKISVFRPYYFFDMDEMAQPSFSVNEKLEFTRVSHRFLEVFAPNSDRVFIRGYKLMDFLKEQKFEIYDAFGNETHGSLEKGLESILDSQSSFADSRTKKGVNYLNIKKVDRNNNESYFVLFITFQTRHVGLQGTIVDATSKVDLSRESNIMATRAFEDFVHDFKQPLSNIIHCVMNCELIFESSSFPEDSYSLLKQEFLELSSEISSLERRSNITMMNLRSHLHNYYTSSRTISESIFAGVSAVRSSVGELDVNVELNDEVKEVTIQELDLTSITINILRNSFSHNRSEKENLKIRIIGEMVDSKSNIVKISFEDNGAGFEADIIDKISANDFPSKLQLIKQVLERRGGVFDVSNKSAFLGGASVELKFKI
ncbi:hypothetical protein POV27_02115 [Aureisphaera galaxeae]|uniref:hypothetical protein n=1 Tax=Aureisphaera galaxeae TaxID=1538023 RepID=UPI002350C4D1|nr:hypothetical protein [Aureisphaera galaxeae]MDC8002836.1 hypothetical protein [Aureisphaera galaxeae]